MERSTEESASTGSRHAQDTQQHAARARALADSHEPREWLQRTIETEIIPRIMLAHGAAAVPVPDGTVDGPDAISGEDVESFTALVLRDDSDALAGFVAGLREREVALERVYLGLIAPAARRLGVMWEEDKCDFAQVTLGLWRLQNLVFDLSPQLPNGWTARPEQPRRALLAAAPGSQHTLGLLMVSEFFRRAGWDVWSDPCASEGDLAALMRSEWFDLVGLSIGADLHLQPVRSVIFALRRASRNPHVGVMVGGPLLVDRPQLVSEVGADFTAADARQAVERADAFVAMRSLQS
jgi:methanogenic corrinoid protein MtbC1